MGLAFPLRVGVVALAAGLGLAGCGRRGPLELPPGSPPSTVRDSTTGQQRILDSRDEPGLIQGPDQYYEKSAAAKQQTLSQRPPPPPINGPPAPPPRKPFVLDPLL